MLCIFPGGGGGGGGGGGVVDIVDCTVLGVVSLEEAES